MYIISSRKDFWNDNEISSNPDEIKEVVDFDDVILEPRETSNYESLIADKKVLLLCHGYNNEPHDVIRAYKIVDEMQSKHIGYFDVVVGYTWPGGDDFLDYYAAKNRASAVSPRFTKLLKTTIRNCSELGIMSHSTGCRISLIACERLKVIAFKKCDKLWQFMMAAAVDNESVETGERYYDATLYNDNAYIFHSKNDDVLGIGFTLAEWDSALGYSGPENIDDIVPATKVINCKHVVESHGAYKRTQQVYDYIRKELMDSPANQFATLR